MQLSDCLVKINVYRESMIKHPTSRFVISRSKVRLLSSASLTTRLLRGGPASVIATNHNKVSSRFVINYHVVWLDVFLRPLANKLASHGDHNMKKSYLWTTLRARLHLVHSAPGKYHWLFLPGGPGLGSESLNGLADILQLPGTVWHVDFPGDGSNTTPNDAEYFSRWSEALVEVASALENVIVVAHSSGGMFSLATPALEDILTGLVLMDSAPDASWQQFFGRYVKEHPLAEAEKLQALYDADPSNETLKKLTIACAPYFSTKKSAQAIILLLESLPFNYKTHLWAAENFDQTYKAKWVPRAMPALIFAGDQDPITPLTLFLASPDFQRENILIRKIDNASHFPWVDNPAQVKQVFREYCERL